MIDGDAKQVKYDMCILLWYSVVLTIYMVEKNGRVTLKIP